jgi:hypothetical protein
MKKFLNAIKNFFNTLLIMAFCVLVGFVLGVIFKDKVIEILTNFIRV